LGGRTTRLTKISKNLYGFLLISDRFYGIKVWAHQITPEENAQCLPALLNVHCGNQEQEFDLGQSDGQMVLPITGEACRLEVTMPEVSSA
jgi:hypothetical protein